MFVRHRRIIVLGPGGVSTILPHRPRAPRATDLCTNAGLCGIGLTPVEWRVEIRALRCERNGNLAHLGTSFHQHAGADARMQALTIVEYFGAIEHCRLGIIASAVAGVVDMLLSQRGKKLSIGALSRQLPLRLIDCSMPCRSSTRR